MTTKFIKKIIFLPVLILFYYMMGCFLLYIISAILFLNKITPDLKLVQEYQRNFNVHSGTRNIWQGDLECIKFDVELVYVPAENSCKFKNIEFDTEISFDKYGRKQTHPLPNLKNIAVIGDSVAMGWGVNDDETFSHFLEKKLKIPVYNLAVSGYGTYRQFLYLKKKEKDILKNIDTIIVQYHYNDLNENIQYKKNTLETAKKKFFFFSKKPEKSHWKLFKKFFRYSVIIPYEIITKKNKLRDFKYHKIYFLKALENFPEFKNKKIIVFHTNPYEIKFKNYPLGQDDKFKNIFFYDLQIKDSHFFQVDDHLSVEGNKYVAEKLADIINKK